MSELLFLADWLPIKEKSWSGTRWGIFQSLKKYYSIVDINTTVKESFIDKLLRKVLGWDLNPKYLKKKEEIVKPYLSSRKQNIVFQFSNIIYDKSETKTYVYIDLSFDYVLYMKQNIPNLGRWSFADISIKNLNYRRHVQNQYFNSCSGIFTMGHWLKKDLIERVGIPAEKVHHIGGGVNINASCIRDDLREGNKILFVGRDFERKGGEIVLKAFSILLKTMPKAELYIAGPKRNPIKNYCKNTFFLGDVSNSDITSLMQKCDLFCMPSYFEAYGLVFIEALVSGMPCIGRNAYEMPFFIEEGKTGLLLEEDSPEILASMMKRVLTEKEFGLNVRRKRQYYLNEYSWDTVAERVHDIINCSKQ